jgi:hypothetical protein
MGRPRVNYTDPTDKGGEPPRKRYFLPVTTMEKLLALVATALTVAGAWLGLQTVRLQSQINSMPQTSATAPSIVPGTSTPTTAPFTTSNEPNTTSHARNAVLKSGKVDLTEGYGFDADKGLVTDADPGGGTDVWYSIYAAWGFSPYDGKLSPVDKSANSRDDCISATRFTDGIPMDDLEVGLQFCVQSDKGRLGLLRILQVPNENANPPTLTFRYTTWDKES